MGIKSRLLDVSAGARRARARDLGFDPDDVWYHGTNRDVDAFNPGMATFLSSSPDVASDYASYMRSQTGSNVIPTHTRGNVLLVDADYNDIRAAELAAGEKYAGVTADDYPNGTELYDWARQNGYDAVQFDRVTDDVPGSPTLQKPSSVRAVLDPANIRSVNANFDSEKLSSSRLLDSFMLPGVATAVAAGGMLASEEAIANTTLPGVQDTIRHGYGIGADKGAIQPAANPYMQRVANALRSVDESTVPVLRPFVPFVQSGADWAQKAAYGHTNWWDKVKVGLDAI